MNGHVPFRNRNDKASGISYIALILSLSFFFVSPAPAENRIYPDDAKGLREVNGNANSLSSVNLSNVSSNKITLKPVGGGVIVPEYVYGGFLVWGATASVTGNTVTIMSGAEVKQNVHGGFILRYNLLEPQGVSGNTVTIEGAKVGGIVYGGRVSTDVGSAGTATTGNTVSIKDSTISGNIYGAHAKNTAEATPAVTNNAVTLSGTSVIGATNAKASVYGGYIFTTNNRIQYNSVTISDSVVVWGDVYGALQDKSTAEATAEYNSVSVNGGTIHGDIYGGVAKNTTNNSVMGNAIKINMGAMVGTVVVDGSLYGGKNEQGATVESNTVEVKQAAVGKTTTNSIYGGYGYKNVNTNKVTVSDSKVGGGVYGGYSSNNGTITKNIVEISESEVGASAYGGWGKSGATSENTMSVTANSVVSGAVYGGYNQTGNATKNILIFANSEVNGVVYGSYGATGSTSENTIHIDGGKFNNLISAGHSEDALSTNNTVIISGSQLGGDVYAGSTGLSTVNSATNNKMVVSKISNSMISLWGIHDQGGNKTYNAMGNKLDVISPISVAGVYNFGEYTFTISGFLKDEDILLDVASPVTLQNVGEVILKVDESSGRITAQNFNVINKVDGNYEKHQVTIHGALEDYIYDVAKIGEAIRASRAGGHVRNNVNIFGSPHRAVLTHINYISDFITQVALDEARAATGLCGEKSGEKCIASASSNRLIRSGGSFFGAASGASLSHNAGAPTDLQGVSMLAGYAYGFPLYDGLGLVAGFVESGFTSFSSQIHDDGTGQDVHGSGSSRQYGFGVLGRYEYEGVHVEASARAGKTNTRFSNDLSRTNVGGMVDYTVNPAYYAAHVGVGYTLGLLPGLGVDLNSRYFWTHQNSSNAEALGYSLNFAAGNSYRWYNEAVVNAHLAPGVKVYMGGGYEWEFDNSVAVTVHDVAGDQAAVPSLKGGTGVARLGVTLGAMTDSGALDLGLQGYAGKRNGVSGTLKFRCNF